MAGVVWPESPTSSKWEGKGFHHPISMDSSATLELFAITRTLEMTIEDIEKEPANVIQHLPGDKALFQGKLAQTRSHTHNTKKEVFVFTDGAYALRRIDGDLAYSPNLDVANELEEISRHSRTLHSLAVHVELHLSPKEVLANNRVI